MNDIIETVTVERVIDDRLADLIYFARRCIDLSDKALMDDGIMIARANSFWDEMHGE